jgi:hypothetical protein
MTRAASVALAGGLLATPLALHLQGAGAANNVTITAPANNAQINGNAVSITATVNFPNDRLASWKVEVAVTPPSGQAPQWTAVPDTASHPCANPNATGSSVNIDCVWDTTKALPNGAPSANNTYLVMVTAVDSGPFNAGTYPAQISTVVTNPVATPTGLTLAFNDGTQKLTVSWNANTEPDITKYVLNETINTKTTGWSLTPAQAHCTKTSCNWSRQITSGGTYKYDVVAVRNAPGTTSGTVSSPSSGSKQATFADPNPTTTTTRPADPGSTGGSTGGSAGGTGGTTSGATKPGTPSSKSGESTSVNGFRVVQIAGGGPGTVSSGGSASGRVFGGGGGGGGLVGEGAEPDTGFSGTLPYKTPKADDKPESISQAIANIPSRIITDESARKKAMSLIAIGLVLFVFAMQVRFITRRAAQQA